MEPKEEVAGSEPGDDGERSNNVSVNDVRRIQTKKRIMELIRSKGLMWLMLRKQGWTRRK